MGQPEPESFTARFPQRGRAPAEAVAPPRDPEPLPAPTGRPPYRLDLESLLPADEISQIRDSGHLTFHMVGDVGGVKRPEFQLAVAGAMANQAHAAHDPARFLYILGDVVYYNGEARQYYPQFYEPYADYPAPILAVPGNHDGTPIDENSPSLAAFVANFCAAEPQVSPDARDVRRLTMTQPYVYFTLTTPFITIIGMYDNVVADGFLDDEQKQWLAGEMRAAPEDRPMILASHHPMLSLDMFHGPSEYMERVVDEAIQASGRIPTAVFAGHVHNYQRWSHRLSDEESIPFVVSGGGGYWNLHHIMAPDRSVPALPYTDVRGNSLLRFEDHAHSFTRLDARPDGITLWQYRVDNTPGSVATTLVETVTLPSR
jgi:3',5'-cyclic AMP phosphodiesterase CpdA